MSTTSRSTRKSPSAPQYPSGTGSPLEPYVVVLELTWDNGTEVIEVRATGAEQALDVALAELFDDYDDPDVDIEPDDTGHCWHGGGDHEQVRLSHVIAGSIVG